MNWRVLEGDSLAVLKALPERSVQTCITSPPYYGLRDYGVEGQLGLEPTPDEYVANLVAVFREVRRVLRDDGTLWLNLGSSYASGDTQTSRSRPGVPACGSDGRERSGSPALDSACLGLCDGCLDDFLRHRDRSVSSGPPLAPAPPLDGRTDRGSEPAGSGQVASGAASPDAPGSTTLESWLRLRGECSRCDSRAASLSGLGSVSPDALASARSSAYSAGTDPPWPTSAARTVGTEPLGLAWGDYTSTLKPKDLIPTPWMVAMALQSDGWWLRSEIIWAKPNPMPESVTDRPTRAHEQVFLLSKSARYFYDADAQRDALGPPGNGLNVQPSQTVGSKPSCPHNDDSGHAVVLDPFSGAGTTGLVALRHNRSYVGIELNPTYAEMSRNRLRDDQPMFNVPAELAA